MKELEILREHIEIQTEFEKGEWIGKFLFCMDRKQEAVRRLEREREAWGPDDKFRMVKVVTYQFEDAVAKQG